MVGRSDQWYHRRDFGRICGDRTDDLEHHLVDDDEVDVRNGIRRHCGLFHDDGKYGRGDLRSVVGASHSRTVHAVRLGIVCGGRRRGGFRSRNRVSKRQGKHQDDRIEHSERLFCLFAHRRRADITIQILYLSAT